MSNCEAHDKIGYGIEKVDGLEIFYRESGDPSKQTVVLLHGCPCSSHQYQTVLSNLGDEFHLIAPDYPGFGDSSFINPSGFDYTFDHLAEVVDKFLTQRELDSYILTIQDYGAPIGFRIATKHPKKIAGFVVLNANVSIEGFNQDLWEPIFDYWEARTEELSKTISTRLFSREGLLWQYTHGTKNPHKIDLENWELYSQKMGRQGQHQAQLDLIYDFRNNVKLYQSWQKYLREWQPPVLLIWGKNDGFFPEEGAEAYIKNAKNIDYNILDTGHFPLVEESNFIVNKMRSFLREILN